MHHYKAREFRRHSQKWIHIPAVVLNPSSMKPIRHQSKVQTLEVGTSFHYIFGNSSRRLWPMEVSSCSSHVESKQIEVALESFLMTDNIENASQHIKNAY